MLKQRVRNKNLKLSSRNWINRQINDEFVIKARQNGYRSRASFKILEIQEKYKIFNNNSIVIDLGAAPGGWSQVISPICKKIIALDLLPMDSLPNVDFIQGDFLNNKCIEIIKNKLNGSKVDIILSDMAPNTCGIQKVDHLRIMSILEHVYEFAKIVLNDKGSLVAKVFQGGAFSELNNELKKDFKQVFNFKPKSSRKQSTELYIVCKGFKKDIDKE